MSTDPTAADHLLALLAVIKEPDAHKARLDELIAQERATDEKIAALNDMAADTRRQHTAAEATTIVLNNRKTAMDAREAEIGERAKQLDLATANQRTSAQQIEQALKRREAAVTAREKAVEQRESEVKEMKAETSAALESANALKDKLQRQAAEVSRVVAQS